MILGFEPVYLAAINSRNIARRNVTVDSFFQNSKILIWKMED